MLKAAELTEEVTGELKLSVEGVKLRQLNLFAILKTFGLIQKASSTSTLLTKEAFQMRDETSSRSQSPQLNPSTLR